MKTPSKHKLVIADVDNTLINGKTLFHGTLETFNTNAASIISRSFNDHPDRLEAFLVKAMERLHVTAEKLVANGKITEQEFSSALRYPVTLEDTQAPEEQLMAVLEAGNRLAHCVTRNKQDPELMFRNPVLRMYAADTIQEKGGNPDQHIFDLFSPALEVASKFYRKNMQLSPGLEETIREMHRTGTELVLMTNGEEARTRFVHHFISERIPEFADVCTKAWCRKDSVNEQNPTLGDDGINLSLECYNTRFPTPPEHTANALEIHHMPMRKPDLHIVDEVLARFSNQVKLKRKDIIFVGDHFIHDGLTAHGCSFVHCDFVPEGKESNPAYQTATKDFFPRNFTSYIGKEKERNDAARARKSEIQPAMKITDSFAELLDLGLAPTSRNHQFDISSDAQGRVR